MGAAQTQHQSASTLPTELGKREGWPWDQELKEFPTPDKSWPRISIVTPNYNYGTYIERTIRSVLAQNYPNLEFIIIDDGSTDDSVQVIRKFEKYLAYWTTGANRGQSAVINAGLKRATGDIFNWLNSDDYLLPGALFEVAKRYQQGYQVVVGACETVDLNNQILSLMSAKAPTSVKSFLVDYGHNMPQPSVFIDRRLTAEAGGITEDLRYLMDWELYIRLALRAPQAKYVETSHILSRSVFHPRTKTLTLGDIIRGESKLVLRRSAEIATPSDRAALLDRLKRFEAEDAITALRSNPSNSMGGFLEIVKGFPKILGTRFFWGAVFRHLKAR
jgi:glycosyltransferase involved in cell wall biosynthesis